VNKLLDAPVHRMLITCSRQFDQRPSYAEVATCYQVT